MNDHEPILTALRDLKQDMRDGFESLGKRMDSMEGDLKGNIKDTATLTERVRGLSDALAAERDTAKTQAEKQRESVVDLYEKDRLAREKAGALEKRVYIISAALLMAVEGGKTALVKMIGL